MLGFEIHSLRDNLVVRIDKLSNCPHVFHRPYDMPTGRKFVLIHLNQWFAFSIINN